MQSHLHHASDSSSTSHRFLEYTETFQDAIIQITGVLQKKAYAPSDWIYNEEVTALRQTLKNIPLYNFYDDQGQQYFLYLCAALLKKGIDYASVYHYAIDLLPSGIGYVDDGEVTEAEQKRRDEKLVQWKIRHEKLLHYIRMAPLIAHGILSFDEMPKRTELSAWLELNRQHHERKPYVELVERFQFFEVLPLYFYGDDWEKSGCATGVKNTRDKLLTFLLKKVQPYSAVYDKINALLKSPLQFEELGACVELTDASIIQDIILSINANVLDNLELNVFQKENQKRIAEIKAHFEAKHDFIRDSEFAEVINSIASQGTKSFVYLCAALLKEGLAYDIIHDFGIDFVAANTDFGYDCGPCSEERYKERRETDAWARKEQEDIMHVMRYLPFIAYGLCSYQDMDVWFSYLQKTEPKHSYIQIMDRFKWYDITLQVKKKYGCDVEEDKKDVCIDQRNEILATLQEKAVSYPLLFEKIKLLQNSDPDFGVYDYSHLFFPDAEAIQSIILQLNFNEFKKCYLSSIASVNTIATSNTAFFTLSKAMQPSEKDHEEKAEIKQMDSEKLKN